LVLGFSIFWIFTYCGMDGFFGGVPSLSLGLPRFQDLELWLSGPDPSILMWLGSRGRGHETSAPRTAAAVARVALVIGCLGLILGAGVLGAVRPHRLEDVLVTVARELRLPRIVLLGVGSKWLPVYLRVWGVLVLAVAVAIGFGLIAHRWQP
jgi:hypothetical protein